MKKKYRGNIFIYLFLEWAEVILTSNDGDIAAPREFFLI